MQWSHPKSGKHCVAFARSISHLQTDQSCRFSQAGADGLWSKPGLQVTSLNLKTGSRLPTLLGLRLPRGYSRTRLLRPGPYMSKSSAGLSRTSEDSRIGLYYLAGPRRAPIDAQQPHKPHPDMGDANIRIFFDNKNRKRLLAAIALNVAPIVE